MKFISEAAMQQLENRIRSIEQRTTGELITVITDRSDDYRYIALLCAALAALAVPGLYVGFDTLFADVGSGSGNSQFGTIYAVQGAVFAGLGMLFIWSPYRMALIPIAVKQKRASALAHRQFDKMILSQLHSPVAAEFAQTDTQPDNQPNRPGPSVPVVMVFVSVAEHYVEIITNDTVAAVIADSVWDVIVEEFIEAVQRDEVNQGFENAIAQTGLELVKYFPANRTENDAPLVNRLPDRLIEISH